MIHCILPLKRIAFSMPFVEPCHQEHDLSCWGLFRVHVCAARPLDSVRLCMTEEPVLLLVNTCVIVYLWIIGYGFTVCWLLTLLQLAFGHLQAADLTHLPSPSECIPLLAIFASLVHLRK